MSKNKTISVPAIRYTQGHDNNLYSLVLEGKRVNEVAKVAHLGRDGNGVLTGFQRPEVSKHIGEIRDYIDLDSNPMIPNSIVIAFTKPIKFVPFDKTAEQGVQMGMLTLPLDGGLIVDGQQRHAAIRDAERGSFPMSVVAFYCDNETDLRKHFVLVNKSKPLPSNMITELLPTIDGTLPSNLEARKLPAMLCGRLNDDADSPLHGLIRTSTNVDGFVKDNTVIKMIEQSLQEGYLFNYRDPLEIESMVDVLKCFWRGVAMTFRDAWGKPLSKSRIFHQAGFTALGCLMDAICEDAPENKRLTERFFAEELKPLKDYCAWTEGTWDMGPDGKRDWNAIQNTQFDIKRFIAYMLRTYKGLKKQADKKVG
jgi:DGQHR domain-containing protein